MADLSRTAFLAIRKAFLIAVATTFIGLIIPGLVAYKEQVFDSEAMERHAIAFLSPEVQVEFQRYHISKADAERKMIEINTAFLSPGTLTNEQVASLNAQRSVAEKLATARPPVYFLPFYLSSAMLTWVLTLTPVAWLALLFHPGKSPFRGLNRKYVISTGFLAYVSYQWTVWTRYFVLKNNGRKVVGFANYDVSHAAFWLQELHTILFWLLLSLVCYQWLQFAEEQSRNSLKSGSTLSDVARRLSDAFLKWQLASLLLALTFFPFTAFYWEQVVNSGDVRFLPAAIILHVMWFGIWAVVTVPLFQAMSRWRNFKELALEGVLNGRSTTDVVQALDAAEPIGDWAKAASAFLTALSFVAPLTRALLLR